MLLLRGMRRLAICHAAGQTGVATLRLQYDKSQFEAKVKADLGVCAVGNSTKRNCRPVCAVMLGVKA